MQRKYFLRLSRKDSSTLFSKGQNQYSIGKILKNILKYILYIYIHTGILNKSSIPLHRFQGLPCNYGKSLSLAINFQN